MTQTFKTLSWIALLGTILPPVLFLLGTIDLDVTRLIMLVATVGWFATAPLKWSR